MTACMLSPFLIRNIPPHESAALVLQVRLISTGSTASVVKSPCSVAIETSQSFFFFFLLPPIASSPSLCCSALNSAMASGASTSAVVRHVASSYG